MSTDDLAIQPQPRNAIILLPEMSEVIQNKLKLARRMFREIQNDFDKAEKRERKVFKKTEKFSIEADKRAADRIKQFVLPSYKNVLAFYFQDKNNDNQIVQGINIILEFWHSHFIDEEIYKSYVQDIEQAISFCQPGSELKKKLEALERSVAHDYAVLQDRNVKIESQCFAENFPEDDDVKHGDQDVKHGDQMVEPLQKLCVAHENNIDNIRAVLKLYENQLACAENTALSTLLAEALELYADDQYCFISLGSEINDEDHIAILNTAKKMYMESYSLFPKELVKYSICFSSYQLMEYYEKAGLSNAGHQKQYLGEINAILDVLENSNKSEEIDEGADLVSVNPRLTLEGMQYILECADIGHRADPGNPRYKASLKKVLDIVDNTVSKLDECARKTELMGYLEKYRTFTAVSETEKTPQRKKQVRRINDFLGYGHRPRRRRSKKDQLSTQSEPAISSASSPAVLQSNITLEPTTVSPITTSTQIKKKKTSTVTTVTTGYSSSSSTTTTTTTPRPTPAEKMATTTAVTTSSSSSSSSTTTTPASIISIPIPPLPDKTRSSASSSSTTTTISTTSSPTKPNNIPLVELVSVTTTPISIPPTPTSVRYIPSPSLTQSRSQLQLNPKPKPKPKPQPPTQLQPQPNPQTQFQVQPPVQSPSKKLVQLAQNFLTLGQQLSPCSNITPQELSENLTKLSGELVSISNEIRKSQYPYLSDEITEFARKCLELITNSSKIALLGDSSLSEHGPSYFFREITELAADLIKYSASYTSYPGAAMPNRLQPASSPPPVQKVQPNFQQLPMFHSVYPNNMSRNTMGPPHQTYSQMQQTVQNHFPSSSSGIHTALQLNNMGMGFSLPTANPNTENQNQGVKRTLGNADGYSPSAKKARTSPTHQQGFFDNSQNNNADNRQKNFILDLTGDDEVIVKIEKTASGDEHEHDRDNDNNSEYKF